jgi:hypothetical protein
MTRFTAVFTLAAAKKAHEAQRRVEAHERICVTCRLGKKCFDRAVIELEREMHESKAIAQ